MSFERNAPCECLPGWFKETVVASASGQCAGCREPLDPSQPRAGQTFMIPCAHVANRVHTHAVLFHVVGGMCAVNHTPIQQQSYDVLPMLPQNIPKNMIENIRLQCLATHQRNGSRCNTCGLYGEKENISLKTCAKCLMVRYCTRDCQKADWSTHRDFCNAKMASRKAAQGKPKPPKEHQPVEPYCPCFTEQDRRIFERQGNMCSNHECDRRVTGPVFASVYLTECTLNGRTGKMHTMTTSYCTNRCQRKTVVRK